MIIIDDDGVMHKVVPIEVLDKIRAEIENLADSEDSMLTGSWGQGLKDALDIIDKHTKGDSEQ